MSQFNVLASGTNNQVVFTPNDKGIYRIYANDMFIQEYTLKGWFGWIPKFAWYTWLIIIGVIILVIVLIFRKKIKISGGEKAPPYEFNV